MTRSSPQYLLTCVAGHPFAELVRELITQHSLHSICDVGGGANPILSLEEIEAMGLRYVVADVSQSELAKAGPGYETRTLHDETLDLGDVFDLVITKFVAEHVADPARFHAAVRDALRPGGLAAHFFPTLPSPPFVLNRVLGHRARVAIDLLQPGQRHEDGPLPKFRPYYRWCEGPTRRQYRRFASVGFDVEQYVVLVGHTYYARFPALQRASDALSRAVVRFRVPALSTYALLVVRRR